MTGTSATEITRSSLPAGHGRPATSRTAATLQAELLTANKIFIRNLNYVYVQRVAMLKSF
jgi:hypothetical protein